MQADSRFEAALARANARARQDAIAREQPNPAERQIQHLRSAQVRARLAAFEVRIALEPAAARLAALHRSEDELFGMKGALVALTASHAAAKPGDAHDWRLHRIIAEASRNPMFLVAFDTLNIRTEGMIAPGVAILAEAPQQRAGLEQEHATIVEAIERGDADCAAAAMRLHLLCARRRVLSMRASEP